MNRGHFLRALGPQTVACDWCVEGKDCDPIRPTDGQVTR
jgi:hypothetical protein